jgi:hypothetical protein
MGHAISIEYCNISSSEIPVLQDQKTLYTFDPRSIFDECLGKHRTIVSCENMLTNVLKDQNVAVNQYAIKHTDPNRNRMLVAQITGDPRISLYRRLRSLILPDEIKRLYVAIPHPEADQIALEKNWSINCSYPDFLAYNNKIEQKKLLGDMTPTWKIIDPKAYLFDGKENYYFKRKIGAGGYATFHVSDRSGMELAIQKYPARWFREVTAEGEPRSLQILRYCPGKYIIFGYSEMKIQSKKNYAGGIMKKVAYLPEFLKEEIGCALERLDPLFKNYSGFMGLDFLENGRKMQVLEANVRVTMATFATLRLNESTEQELEFYHFQ